VEARQHPNGSEQGSRFMLCSQGSHCHDKTNSGVVNASVDSSGPRASGGKGECQVRLTGIEREYCQAGWAQKSAD